MEDKSLIWDVISDSGEGDVVLAVDYSVNGRREAGFKDFAKLLGPDVNVWETLSPPIGEEAGMSADEYVERWVEVVRGSGRRVSAVLGYCASSAFAGAIAEGVARFQEDGPKPVLFDPTPSTAWTILHFGFFKVIESLSASLTEEEIVQVQKDGWECAARDAEDLEAFRTEIVGVYRKVGELAFDRIGLAPELGEQMVAWFRAYVAYLIAAAELTGTFDLSGATVVCSSALKELPGEVLDEYRFDVDHSELLNSEEVAREVAGFLAV
jgi:hypothetical protein